MSEQQRLVEFRVGDVVEYRVMNTPCVVTAVCRRKFMTKFALRDPEWNWIGQQLVRVRSISGYRGIEDNWQPSNLFRLAADQKAGA